MRGAAVVFLKECRENLRDRRSVMNALLWGPVFMPAMFFAQLIVIAEQMQEVWDRPPSIAVAGAEHAPGLMEFLRQQGAEIRAAPDNPDRAVREQVEDVVLVVPPGFPAQWRSGEPAELELVFDSSRRRSESRQQRVRSLLDQYARSIGARRLLVRGVDPQVVTPLRAQPRDIARGAGRAAAILAAFMPFVLMFSAFLGGFYLAVDTTAGERERQSLEPLLINPVPRAQLLVGKIGATVAFSMAATAISIVAFAVALMLTVNFTAVDALGLDFSVSPQRWAGLVVLLLPVVLLASCLQTLVAAASRSFREAQTYLQFLMFVPMIPCFIVMFSPVRPRLADMAIPFWSQTVLIDRMFRGESFDWPLVAAAAAATVVAALLVGLAIARLYRSERMLFSAS